MKVCVLWSFIQGSITIKFEDEEYGWALDNVTVTLKGSGCTFSSVHFSMASLQLEKPILHSTLSLRNFPSSQTDAQELQIAVPLAASTSSTNRKHSKKNFSLRASSVSTPKR